MLRAIRATTRVTPSDAAYWPSIRLWRSSRIITAAVPAPCPLHLRPFATAAAAQAERPPEAPKRKRAGKPIATPAAVSVKPTTVEAKLNSLSPSSIFAGTKVCISGKFESGRSQTDLRELLVSQGASVVDSPTASCTHLLCSSPDSSKAKGARAKGIPLVKEGWIMQSVDEGRISEKPECYWLETMSSEMNFKKATERKEPIAPAATKQRAAELRAQIKHADTCYYGSATASPLSDAEYDDLYRELLSLEAKYPSHRTVDSPTNRPGAPAGLDPQKEEEGPTVDGKELKVEAHRLAMLSLQSCTSIDKVRKWDASLKRGLKMSKDHDIGELRYRLELKYDGIAVSAIYRAGKLHAVRTRGTGVLGEDIRNGVDRWVSNLPQSLKIESVEKAGLLEYVEGEIEVRGEVLLTTSAHAAYIREMRALGSTTPEEDGSNAPARNLCAGLLRRETFRTKEEGPASPLAFIAYSLHILDGRIRHTTAYLSPPLRFADTPESERKCFPKTQSQALEILKTLGFDITPKKTMTVAGKETQSTTNRQVDDSSSWLCSSIDSAIEVVRRWSLDREGLDFGIDGVVMKLDDLEFSSLLGATGHHPKAALAFKFPAKSTHTVLEDVTWQVGREGKVTPVALLQPVSLDGVTISRASLHNCALLSSLQLRKGDRVVVERRGDVIPYVAGKVADGSGSNEVTVSSPTPIALPISCPCSLASSLTRRSTSGDPEKFDLFCESPDCPQQMLGRLVHYCSKKSLDIDGLGKKSIEALMKEGFLTNLESVVDLPDKEADLLVRCDAGELSGWGEKRIRKICQSILSSHQSASQETLLVAAGLPRLGKAQAKALMERFGGVERMVRAREEDMQGVRRQIENHHGCALILFLIPGIGEKLIPLFLESFQELKSGLLPQWKKHGYIK